MAVTKDIREYSLPTIFNLSFDREANTLVFQPAGYDGTNVPKRIISSSMATKIVEDSGYTYIGIAAPGTLQTEAKWQVKRIDETTPGTTIITWADGDSEFDNTVNNITSLSFV